MNDQGTDRDDQGDEMFAPPAPPAPPEPTMAPTPKIGEGRALRDIALSSVPQHLRENLLTWASENQITTPNDAFWPIAAAMANAMGATSAVGDQIEEIRSATRGVGDLIFNQTRRAGTELQAGVKDKIDKSMAEGAAVVAKIITRASNAGAAALTTAAAALEQKGEESGDKFIQSWRRQATQALDRHAVSSLRRSLTFIIVSLFVAIFLGGGVVWGLLDMTGHILPWNYHLVIFRGRPDCGYAQTLQRLVCGVTR